MSGSARDNGQWFDDPDLRAKIGLSSHRYVAKYFNMEHTAQEISGFFYRCGVISGPNEVAYPTQWL